MIESFLKYLQYEKRLSPHTTLAYKNDLLQFQAFLDKNYPGEPIDQTNHGIIRSWIISLVEGKIQWGVQQNILSNKQERLKKINDYLRRIQELQQTLEQVILQLSQYHVCFL